MLPAHQISLVGFDPFENTTFESFIRLATRRDPGFEIAPSLAAATLLIINSDNAEALVAALKQRRPQQRVLLIGPSTQPAAAGLPVHPRPIRFMAVLGAIDKLLAEPLPGAAPAPAPVAAAPAPVPSARPAAPARPEFAATQPFMPLDETPERPQFAATQPFAPLEEADDDDAPHGFAATQPFAPRAGEALVPPVRMPRPAPREDLITADSLASYKRNPEATAAPAPAAAPVSPAAPAPVQARAAASPTPPAPPAGADYQASSGFLGIGHAPVPAPAVRAIDDVLVVDDSDVTLKFMQNRLGRLGFRVSLAHSGEEALDAVGNRNFRFVFLDVMMEGMDGFQACRAIKRRSYTHGKAPVVFMLSSRGGVIDKMRGSLAGADAYLTKPLNEPELNRLLAQYEGQGAGSYAATQVAGPGGVPKGDPPQR